VIVADTGVGIDGDQLANVFREFYRAAPSRGEAMGDGLGLGLAIVQRLATLLDHRVTIESEPRKGTLVRIRVPRAAPPDQATESPPSVADKLRGTKVLVVDDEAPIREAMQGLLTQWGCDVATAATGDEAVRSALARRPDVVLCDLNLAADEDGVEVVDRLRRECGCPVQCAFVTGEADSDRIARARATGHPIAFKPTAPGKLRAILEHLTVIESPGQPAAAAPAESSRRAHSPSFG
jgi:CheY-like chemotaxis protein